MNCYNNNNNITTTKVQLNHDFQKPLFRNKVLAIFIAIFQFFAQAYRCIIKKFRADRVQPIPIDLNKLDVEYDIPRGGNGGEYVKNKIIENYGYNVENVIKTIKDLRANGFKIGIFVGRTSDQILPKDNNDTKWFTLDINFNYQAGDSVDKTINKNVLLLNRHLCVDLKTQAHLVANLADKVVVDPCVLKFFNNEHPWEVMGKLLFDENSTLITEQTAIGAIFYDRQFVNKNEVYNIQDKSIKKNVLDRICNYKQGNFDIVPVVKDLSQQDKNTFIKDVKSALIEKIEKYLRDIFTSVENKKEPFPHTSNHECSKYFILTGYRGPR